MKKLTKEQAVKKLKETKNLTTGLLQPLNISFESWLKYAQIENENRQKEIINMLIKKLEVNNV